MARPKKQLDDRRSEVLPAVRVTRRERTQIRARAQASRLPLAAYLRTCALSDAEPRQGAALPSLRRAANDIELIVELKRVGNNLNQIARKLNSGQMVDPGELPDVQRQLREQLQRVNAFVLSLISR